MATQVRPLKGPIRPIPSEEQKKALADRLARKKYRDAPLSLKLGDVLKLAYRKRK
jgi:hypothetical protein